MIRTLLAFAISIFLSLPVFAGDTAQRNIIGFSPNGVWFAFEEFGIADGSGAPYANIFVINIDNNIWAKGTPIRVNFGEKVAPVSAARKEALSKASPVFEKLNIGQPGNLLASNPVTEISANPRRIDFYRNKNITDPANKLSYVLKEFELPNNTACKSFDIKEKGFSLSLTKGGSPLTQVYKDESVPVSRHCPTRYAISDIIEFTPVPNPANGLTSGPTRHIVLIHMFAMGFEGPDSRFLAVPVTLP